MARDPHIDKLIQDLKAKKFQEGEGKRLTDSFGENLKAQFGPSMDGMGKEVVKAIKESLSGLKMPDMPKMPEYQQQEIPQPVVNVEAPIVNVPAPVVNIPAPIVNIPETKFPEFPAFPSEIALKHGARPFPVIMTDVAGKPFNWGALQPGASGGRGDFFTIKDIQTSSGASVIDQVEGAVKVTGSFSVTSSNASTQLIDSSLNAFGTAANPLNVAITSGAASSTKAQIGNSDGDFSQANPLPVVFSSSGSTASALIDSSGVQYSGSNPLPVSAVISAAASTAVWINDSRGNTVSAFPATFLRTSDEPHQLFYDAFDTAIDTTNRWTSTSGNSGVAASNTTGVMTMGTGTVANGYAKLASQPTFTLPIPAWLGVSDAIALPDGAAPISNSYRYWGTGTTPGTPSVSTPVTDGYGFELNTDGKLRAVVYAGGTRTVIQDLSTSGNSTQPLDASYHRYIIYVRTDKAYWYIDGITSAQLVAESNFQSSQVQSLPRLFLTIGNSTPPVSNTTLTCTGATAWDTGKNNVQISDGTLPWRKAAVNSNGAQYVEKIQVSGAVDSVFVVGPIAQGDSTSAIRVIQAGDSVSSMVVNSGTITAVTSITNSIAVVQLDRDGTPKIGDSIGEGDAATALRVVLANNVAYSTAVTGTVTVSSVTNSIASALTDSSGVQYSGSNPLPVTWISGAGATIGAANIDSSGVQYSGSNPFPFTLVTNATATMNVAVTDSSGVQYSGSNPIPMTIVSGALTSVIVVGDLAADAADTGSAPVKIGGIGRQTNPVAVSADGDRVTATFDDLGRQVMRINQARDLVATAYVALTTGTETTLLTAAAASYLDLTMLTATNNSSAATQLDIRATTGGNIIHTMYLPAQTGPIGFAPVMPWPQDSTGNSWTIDMPDQTGTTVYVSALFSKEV